MMNAIGLVSTKETQKLTSELNLLLADYQVFYMNVRGFHWNIKGSNFFELHLKFEELHDDLIIKVDEIAERILTLGIEPLHTFSDYLSQAQIKETPKVSDGNTAVKHILDSFKILLIRQRTILALAGENGDEGSNSLMSDYIREQEKLVWMYSSFLSN